MTERSEAHWGWCRRALVGGAIASFRFVLGLPLELYRASQQPRGGRELLSYLGLLLFTFFPGAVGGLLYEALSRRSVDYYVRWMIAGILAMAILILEVNIGLHLDPAERNQSFVLEMFSQPLWWPVLVGVGAISGRLIAELFDGWPRVQE